MLPARTAAIRCTFAKALDRAAQNRRRQLHRRLFGARAQGLRPRRLGADRKHSRSARRDGKRLLVGQHRLHQGRHQHGRRQADGQIVKETARAHRGPRLHRLRRSSSCSATRRRTTRSWRVPSTASASRTASSTSAYPARAWCARPSQRPAGGPTSPRSPTSSKRPRSRSRAWVSSSRSEASRRLCVPFGIVDLSLAPTPAVGDSVADILEEMGLEQCGAHGTTATLACSMTQ